jgi:hypothetical protein
MSSPTINSMTHFKITLGLGLAAFFLIYMDAKSKKAAEHFDLDLDVYIPEDAGEIAPEEVPVYAIPEGVPADATSYAVEVASADIAPFMRVELLEIARLDMQGQWEKMYVVYVYDARAGDGMSEYFEGLAGDWTPNMITASGEFGSDEYQAAKNYYETMVHAARKAAPE